METKKSWKLGTNPLHPLPSSAQTLLSISTSNYYCLLLLTYYLLLLTIKESIKESINESIRECERMGEGGEGLSLITHGKQKIQKVRDQPSPSSPILRTNPSGSIVYYRPRRNHALDSIEILDIALQWPSRISTSAAQPRESVVKPRRNYASR